MKPKRLFFVSAIFGLFSALSVACGGGDESSSTPVPSPITTRTTAPIATTTAVATAAPVTTSSDTIMDKATSSQLELDNIRYGGTLREPQQFSNALDPKLNNSGMAGDTRWGYEKLLDWSPDFNDDYTHLVPRLAETWSQSSDLTTLTFKLRKGVKWHNLSPVNGREMVADDVVFSMNRYREKDAVNYVAYSDITSIETPDKYTVIVKIKEPNAFAVNDLFAGLDYVVPPELVAEGNGSLSSKLIGTGPYILKKFQFRQGSSHVRNPDYWDKDSKGNPLPYTDSIDVAFITDAATNVAAFRSGQVDVPAALSIDDIIALVKSNTDMRVWRHRSPAIGGQGFTFRTTKAPWNDIRVRGAFNHALDKEKFGDIVVGEGRWDHSGPIPWPYVSNTPFTLDKLGPYANYDPAEAKRLLIQAGFKDGKIKVPTPLAAAQGSSYGPRTAAFQSLFKENGIEIELLSMDFATYNPLYFQRSYSDIALTHHIFAQPNLNWFAQNKFNPVAAQNTAWIDDTELNRVLKEIKITVDPAKQKEYAKFLWDFDTLGSYTVWTPIGRSYYISSSRLRNNIRRIGPTRNATVILPWLADAPRSTP